MECQIAVDIDAPAAVVWAVMSDIEHWPDWTASVREVRRWDPHRPLRPGSRAVVRQPKLPPALWTVTSLTPGRQFVWTAGVPLWWSTGVHTVDPVGDLPASRATLSIKFTGLLGRLCSPLIRDLTERYIRLEAEGLKRRSEELFRS
ncbi:MAG: SRPBCC family protein [Vicinamibacterales bacterium]